MASAAGSEPGCEGQGGWALGSPEVRGHPRQKPCGLSGSPAHHRAQDTACPLTLVVQPQALSLAPPQALPTDRPASWARQENAALWRDPLGSL